MLRYAVFCFVVFVVFAGVSGFNNLSDEDKDALHAAIKPLALTCMEKFGLDPKELEAMMAKPKKDMDPCFVACVFKASGMIDENGMFDKDASVDFIKKTVSSEDAIKHAQELGDLCDKVNEEDVTDGTEGCERAVLLGKCIKEVKSEIELQ